MKRWITPALIGIVLATLTWFGLNVSRHLWSDHRSLHEMIRFLNTAQQTSPEEPPDSPVEELAEESK